MIVVTTPTGEIGHRVARTLLDAGLPVRVVARDPERLAPEIRDRAEVVTGSHGDPETVDRALTGADALFWVVPPNPRAESLEAAYLDFTRPAADAIRRHGVRRVVTVSALGRGTRWANEAGLLTVSFAMDDLIRGTGADVRVLAMPSFMENLLRQVDGIRNAGAIFGPIDGDRKLPTCATEDIAATAARLLQDETWTGQEDVAVLGPEDLSFDEMAATVADVLGKPVRYQQVPFDAFESQLKSAGMTDAFVRGYVQMMRAKNEGIDNAEPRTPESSTPTSFRAWCETVLKPAVLNPTDESK